MDGNAQQVAQNLLRDKELLIQQRFNFIQHHMILTNSTT